MLSIAISNKRTAIDNIFLLTVLCFSGKISKEFLIANIF